MKGALDSLVSKRGRPTKLNGVQSNSFVPCVLGLWLMQACTVADITVLPIWPHVLLHHPFVYGSLVFMTESSAR